uniref:Uncharacterized protein n=1 Tax=Caldicellulosiruptor owensensis TaxID=55205 RepID=A0A7C5V5D3_9FIRM
MITKFIKYQYRSGILFYILFTLSATSIGIWSYYSENVKVQPEEMPKIIVLWLLWIVSLISAKTYHLVRWNRIFKSSERFLLFSSWKFKPEILLFGEILHLILDFFLFSIWFNLLGAIVMTPKRYISLLTLVINKIDINNFYLIVAFIFLSSAIYFWYLTGIVYWNTLKNFSKWSSYISLVFILLAYFNISLSEFIAKTNLGDSIKLTCLFLTNLLIFTALIVFNLKMLKKGLDT